MTQGLEEPVGIEKAGQPGCSSVRTPRELRVAEERHAPRVALGVEVQHAPQREQRAVDGPALLQRRVRGLL